MSRVLFAKLSKFRRRTKGTFIKVTIQHRKLFLVLQEVLAKVSASTFEDTQLPSVTVSSRVDKQFLAISFASNIASIVEPVSISFAAVEFKGLKVDMSFRNSKLRINVSVLEISGPKFN
ncbi:hypothetical protein BCV71DRAFT_232833 [Rhizopus microsporus]|uniref:Uncharacterized protein n=1 Tax=Rhizopus microsporus TaxID=58291 RepID=A0A1X0S8Y4_RHIZD|nr:hypothetical protein BCV71DRAFT_232833 [Rhizopus microsporus]